jgi:NADPH:quinone reductase-like Zn-dependent oxidoreductase
MGPHWQVAGALDQGWIPGWDVAGTVCRAAADGSGPPVGTRVVAWVTQGAWAERVAVPATHLVPLPDTVSFHDAATLPIAGMTAWYALSVGGLAAGKRVLVTGAAGAVGRFALQIAKHADAHVTAVVSSETRGRAIRHLSFDALSIGMPGEGAYDIVLDCVGGRTLAQSFALMAPYGRAMSYGNASGEATTFTADAPYRKPCASLHGFNLLGELARVERPAEGLAALVDLLAGGKLRMDIVRVMDWQEVAAACKAVEAGGVDGKLVMQIA